MSEVENGTRPEGRPTGEPANVTADVDTATASRERVTVPSNVPVGATRPTTPTAAVWPSTTVKSIVSDTASPDETTIDQLPVRIPVIENAPLTASGSTTLITSGH